MTNIYIYVPTTISGQLAYEMKSAWAYRTDEIDSHKKMMFELVIAILIN